MGDSSSIKILLADDQTLLRQALANLLTQHPGLSIVGEASDGQEAIKEVARCRPDVVLLDIEMPNLDGLSAIRIIRQRFSDTKIIVLSAYDNETYLHRALQAGAHAYLLKSTVCDELSETVRLVHKGYSQFSSGIFDKFLSGYKADTNGISPASLSNGDFKIRVKEGEEESLDLSEVLLALEFPLSSFEEFDPDTLEQLVKVLLLSPDIAALVRPNIEKRLANNSENLSLLYLHGVLAHQVWIEPETAFSSLGAGFHHGLAHSLATEELLLFYREAVSIKPHVAFGWLTHPSGLWSEESNSPFLLEEAIRLFGEDSSQARSFLLLEKIYVLKKCFKAKCFPGIITGNTHNGSKKVSFK
jgi:DNA-binding NarL/FixJ family response regulator